MTPNERVMKIKLAMGRMGWSNGGEPGAVKLGRMGQVIASAGTDEWLADVTKAIALVDGSDVFHESGSGSLEPQPFVHPLDRRIAG